MYSHPLMGLSLKSLRRAAKLGSSKAMFNLGVLLEDQGDFGEAEQWHRKAAELGNPKAMFNLGVLLENRGDLEEAKQWYRKSGRRPPSGTDRH